MLGIAILFWMVTLPWRKKLLYLWAVLLFFAGRYMIKGLVAIELIEPMSEMKELLVLIIFIFVVNCSIYFWLESYVAKKLKAAGGSSNEQ